MIPRAEYFRPDTLPEALSVLHERAPKIVVLAGGTDVVTGMQQGDERFVAAEALLDIHHLPELRSVTPMDGGVRIGSAITFSEITSHPLLRSKFPLLAEAASSIGSVQIRNRATLAGNFVNNAACADSVPPLLVYNAQVQLRSLSAERVLPLSEFLLAPNRTALKSDELVTDVLLPALPAGYKGRFLKLGRRRGIAISRITLAVMLKRNGAHVEDLRVASGAVTPIGARFPAVEAKVRGKEVSDDLWISIAQELGTGVLERTGLRWSSPYKLPVLQQMLFGMLCELGGEKRA